MSVFYFKIYNITALKAFYDNFWYDGGENLFRRNFKIYSGTHDTAVITVVFQINSKVWIKSGSENN